MIPERLNLPTFRAMLADLGHPSAAQLAAWLGVHARTVRRWRATDDAPRPVLLALFWLTSWGQSRLSADLYNRATTYSGHIAAVQRENDALRRELARVLAAGDFGSANLPVCRPGVTAADLLAEPPRPVSACGA